MAIEIEYGFDTPKKEETKVEDVRPNLRITRCCANCKFYVPKRTTGGRGFCKYPNPKEKNPAKRLGESLDYQAAVKNWLHCHNTMLCDLYQLRGISSIRPIAEWLGKEILNDGTVKQE